MRKLWPLILCFGCTNVPDTPIVQAGSAEQPSMGLGDSGRSVMRLIDHVEDARVTLTGGQASPDSASKQWELQDWKQLRSDPVRVWTHASPVRMDQGIYAQQPSDLRMMREGRQIGYQKGLSAGRPVKLKKQQSGRWEYHRNRIIYVTDGNPTDQSLLLRSIGDAGADNRLDFSLANMEVNEFVHAPIENGLETRVSLLLPAPSSAAYSITPPKDASLRFGFGLGLSAEAGQTGKARFEVHINGESVWNAEATQESGWQDVSLDLGQYGEQPITLSFSTEAIGDNAYAYSAFSSPEIIGAVVPDAARRIIVVGMDTLRADHLGTHGYDRPTSPGLDQVAEQSIVFDEAWAPSPRTRPSFRSSTTGKWPLDAIDAPTIGSIMRANGFATGGFVANIQLAPRLGFADGFDLWSYDNMADGDIQVDRTLKWLTDRANEDTFVFLHLMDPHIFYEAPEPWKDRFASPLDRRGLKERFNRWEILKARREGKLSKPQEGWIKDRYDGEVAFMDHQLTRLIQAVDKLPGKTLWVFHTDHGEEFFEHDSFEHNHSLYSELVRAVLWIRPPGGWSGGPHRIQHPVSLVDIAPTIFTAAEIPTDKQPDVDGVDLTPFVYEDRTDDRDERATQLEDRPLPIGHMMYRTEQWGVIFRDQKYMIETGTGEQQWFDLAGDPDETTNKATGTPPAEMVDALARAHNWPVLYGWRLGFSSLKKETTLKFDREIGEALVIEPEALRKRRANLEWGEIPPITKANVAMLTVSEDRKELVIMPGTSGTGVIFIEGLTEGDSAIASCSLGKSTIATQGFASMCSRKATVRVGPYLAQDANQDFLRAAPEASTLEALQALGYIE